MPPAAPAVPGFRQAYHDNRLTAAGVLLDAGNHVEAARVAAEVAEIGANPGKDAFDAARVFAACAGRAGADAALSEGRRKELAETYLNRSLDQLRLSAKAGFAPQTKGCCTSCWRTGSSAVRNAWIAPFGSAPTSSSVLPKRFSRDSR